MVGVMPMNQNKYNPNFNSGTFRHKISIFKRTIIKDSYKREVEGPPELICKCWSMIKTLKGQEVVNGDTSFKNTSRFIVRYSKFFDQLFKINEATLLEIHYRGIVYDIKSVINDDEMNKTFTIIGEGRLSNGD